MATWKHLFAFTEREHWSTLSAALAAVCACAAVRTAYAVTLGQVFQVLTNYGKGTFDSKEALSQISKWCVIICFLGFGAMVANTALMSFWLVFGELQAKRAREIVFNSLLRYNMVWYDGQVDGTASLLFRIKTQIHELQTSTSHIFGLLAVDVVSSAASLILAFFFSWKLALVLVSSVPLSAVIFCIVNRKIGIAIDKQKHHLAEASKQVNASVTGIDLVKVYDGVAQEMRQYHRAIQASKKQYMQQACYNAFLVAYMQSWTLVLFFAGFWFGLWLVTKGLSAAQILTTFYATLTALQGLSNIIPQWLVLLKGMSAGQYLSQMTESSRNLASKETENGLLKPRYCLGEIQVKDISFAYPANAQKQVLTKASFHFPAGKTCFIVGKSGSGKSTLGDLLVNFYEPSSGQILVDGQPVEDLDKIWLRKNVTLVQQASVVFHGTFLENITLGHVSPTHVSMDDARRACDMALLQSTVASLPMGMATVIDSVGSGLSGGQKQCLALARARLRDPPILILDEVTSGLDQTSKHLIMEAVRTWRQGKTTLIITHDISQVEKEDYVYVLEDSRIVQEGTCGNISEDSDGAFVHLSLAHDEAALDKGTLGTVTSDAGYNASELDAYFMRHEVTRGLSQRSFHHMHLEKGAASLWPSLTETSSASTSRRDSSIACRDSRVRCSKMILPPTGPNELEWKVNTKTDWQSKIPTTSCRSFMEMIQISGQAVRVSRGISERMKNVPNYSPAASPENQRECGRTYGKQKAGAVKDETQEVENIPLGAIFRTVWPHLSARSRVKLIAGVISCVIAAGCNPVFSYCFARLLAQFWEAGDRQAASQKWSTYMIGVAVVIGVSMYLQRFFMEAVGQAWVDSLRLEGKKRVLLQPKSWFDRPENSSSHINECLDGDAERMRSLVSRFIPINIMLAVIIGASTTWALTISWRLTLVAISTTPIILGTIKLLANINDKWEWACSQEANKTASLMRDVLINIRVTKAFTLEGYLSQRHGVSVKSTYELGLQRALRTGPLFGLSQSTSFFVIALVFWYGSYLTTNHGEMSPGSLQQVANLLLFCVGQASTLISMMPQASVSQTAATKLLRLANTALAETPQPVETQGLSSLFPIIIRNLEFAFPSRPTHQVLHNISFSIEAGTFTAIVGASGCGKSTIIALLLGLYEPSQRPWAVRGQEAGVTCAGINLHRTKWSQVCSLISFVPQTPFLFPTSIAENIAYGLPDTSVLRHHDNLEKAARAADVHDFIISLPQRYNTIVGEGGQTLSGGQSQRICIARALARRPRLLVMDEPTSALDGQTAGFVRETIRRVLEDQKACEMSVLVVTHDREMMRMANRLVVVEDGRVVEEGSFKTLILGGNVFPKLIEGVL
ncbi:ABC a-pheromone efflux pump [Colletotrichum truncatum]|uniref:ABC a-pheromone efflux pump n=1 Tax=Colletotrichum truncatum TaxID=5467 RepID=A0ACC3YS80_COLTU|nr:ABC a-pheromone efflux pump [Colletotrichum truncatum]KAF6789931.1 ABC a-pheromone efflux pump [Colletotrichum truncatum]